MRYFYKLLSAATVAAFLFAFTGCLKDSCTNHYPTKVYTPIYQKLSDFRASVRSEAPRAIETTGKIYLYGNYIFLNELNKGIHIIDNTNPAAPEKFAFINIPGNVDMAVKGDVLYADSYIDLVALDISNPHAVKEAKRLKDVFPNRQYDYGIVSDTVLHGLIVGFTETDTVYTRECDAPRGDILLNAEFNSVSMDKSYATQAPVLSLGKGGSTARFALMSNYLYTIDAMGLQAFEVQDPLQPVKRNNIQITGTIETIFPYRNNLFIGSQNGMFIYDASNPAYPVRKSQFAHLTNCDPVVVENDLAYVTLRSGVTCPRATLNQLDVLNVKDLSNPVLIKTYPMSNPHGLGIDGGKLFICEGKFGLKFLDARKTDNITTAKWLEDVEAYDVIPAGHSLLVTAKDGLYQYDYANLQEPRLLSKLPITVKQ